MKFDGVSEHNKNRETFCNPLGGGAMEYTYYLLAKKYGIDMKPCHLVKEGIRRHFIRDVFYSFEKIIPIFSKRKINNVLDQTI